MRDLLSYTRKHWLYWKKKRFWPHETGISKPAFHSAVQIPLHNINLEVRDAGLGLCYSKINMDHIYIIPKAKEVKFTYQCLSFFLDFYNIHYFCLAKELQNNTHSIIRKHLAKIPWETNHPKQARNLRALPFAGQRNVLNKK